MNFGCNLGVFERVEVVGAPKCKTASAIPKYENSYVSVAFSLSTSDSCNPNEIPTPQSPIQGILSLLLKLSIQIHLSFYVL